MSKTNRRKQYILPKSQWSVGRIETRCKYYDEYHKRCNLLFGKCIGANVCAKYANRSGFTSDNDKQLKMEITTKCNNGSDKMSSILPIKRTMQEQFEVETKEIILAYRSIQKSYQAINDKVQLKVDACMKLMDYEGAQRILADFQPFAQKIKKELENIESILNDFE